MTYSLPLVSSFFNSSSICYHHTHQHPASLGIIITNKPFGSVSPSLLLNISIGHGTVTYNKMKYLFLLLASVALVSAFDWDYTNTITIFNPSSNFDGEVVHAYDHAFYTGLEGPSTGCPCTPGETTPSCPWKDPTVLCGDGKHTLVHYTMTAMSVCLSGFHSIPSPFHTLLYLSSHRSLCLSHNSTFLSWRPRFSWAHVPNLVFGLQVTTPGGQDVFVDMKGQVKYAIAHTAHLPIGAMVDVWQNKTTTPHVIDFDDGHHHFGLVLCPDKPRFAEPDADLFALHAKTKRFERTGCTDIEGLTLTVSDQWVGAFQYD